MGATAIAWAALATSAAGTAASVVSSEKAREQQERAQEARQRIQERRERRQRLQSARERAIRESQIIQAAATQGTVDSSQTQGAISAVGSLSAGNQQFINQISNLQEEQFNAMSKANLYSSQANRYASLANLASQFSSTTGKPTQSTAPTQAGGMSQTSSSGAQQSAIVSNQDRYTNPLPPSPF